MKKILTHFVSLSIGISMAWGGLAMADRTVVFTKANAKVTGIRLESNDSGTTVNIVICGYTKDGTGGLLPSACTVAKDLPVGAFRTAVAPLFSGEALAYWLTDQKL